MSKKIESRELIYFNIRGRAEMIRLLLVETGLEFKDRGIEFSEWPKMKSTTPFGQMPILIEKFTDGSQFVIPQSTAIMRHVARIAGLYGNSEEDRTKADYIADALIEWRLNFNTVAYAPNFLRDKSVVDKYVIDSLPRYPANFEKILAENKDSPYFLGTTISYTDFILFDLIDVHLLSLPDQESFWNKYPKLMELYNAVAARTNVASYLASERRRKNDFKK